MWAWHAGDMGWGWWVAGPLMMLVFWGAVIWLVYALFAGSRRSDDRRATPREIAERRLASGEIDQVEFQRIIDALGRGGT